MDTLPSASELEPRKKLRIRIRADLSVAVQKYEGRTYYIVKDPISLRYYRYTEQERFLIGLLDGKTTLDEAQKKFEQEFRPDRLALEDLERFAQQLLMTRLAHAESNQADREMFKRRGQQSRSEWLQTLTNILYLKLPVFDPDRLLTRMLPSLRWIFTTWFMVLSVGTMLAALLLVATHFEAFRDKLPSSHEFFRFRTMLSLWVAFGVVKIIHEFGHGLSCKAFGGEVHEMGVLFLCLSPCLYCNVSDAWTLADKWKRILISFAGIYVELIMAALATFLWWNTPGRPFLNNLSLSLMVVCSISTVVFNGNPLMRYDGYYILADWLEVPNLRARAIRFLKRVVLAQGLGVRMAPDPYMALGRRCLFLVYVVASYLYSWVVTFSILWFLSRFLKPYKLEAVSTLLACMVAASMIGWPLYRLGKGLQQQGRLPEMQGLRVLFSAVVVAGLLAFVLLVPLPVSQVAEVALVQLHPEAVEKVFVQTPGILERLHVGDGQRVERNDILAEFRNLEVENHLEEARSEHDIRVVQLQALADQAVGTTDPVERAKIEVAVAAATGERNLYAQQVEVYEKMSSRLVLRAPRAGVVMSPPRVDEIGKRWEVDQTTPFCTVGDPDRPRALMPVTPSDYRLLKEELAGAPDLAVTIRLQGQGGKTWKGKLAQLPESEAKEVPFALTLRGGGSLAVKPGGQPNVYVPQSQHYLLGIDFLETDHAFCPGAMAQVKVHCRWRTCAWWLWRTLSSTFDLELLKGSIFYSEGEFCPSPLWGEGIKVRVSS